MAVINNDNINDSSTSLSTLHTPNSLYDYIKTIYPILENSTFEKIVKVICEVFDYVRELNYISTRNYYPYSDNNIKQKAIERSVLIFNKDTEETLKEKTYNAYLFLAELTTKKGIEKVISNYYQKPFDIIDTKELGSFTLDCGQLDVHYLANDGVYGFVVRVYEELSDSMRELLKQILDSVKPSHIGYYIEEIFNIPFFELNTSSSILDRNILK